MYRLMADPENAFVDYVLSIVGPHSQDAVWEVLTAEDGLVEQLRVLVGRDVHLSSQGANLEDDETYFSVRAKYLAAKKLLEYALHLRMYGERAPGGNETWREFDKMTEHFLRELPYPDPRELDPLEHVTVAGMAGLQEERQFYYRAAIKLNQDIEDTLAPALGFEPFQPGDPGYSEDQVNYVVGDHTSESLAFMARDLIIEQRETIAELVEKAQAQKAVIADLMAQR
jgi:hypothetical protein